MEEILGGLPAATGEVEVWTGTSGDCGIAFQPDTTYLVQAFADPKGRLHTGRCSQTTEIDFAAPALALFRRQRDGASLPALIGTVRQPRESGAPGSDPSANILVRLRSGSGTVEARTNEQGVFTLDRLAPGSYEFAPEIPAGYQSSWYLGSSRFKLSGTCQLWRIDLLPTGSILGTVHDSRGQPVRRGRVYVVQSGQPAAFPRETALENDGTFRFHHLARGRYHLLVNPEDHLDPAFPYPRTFYPGVRDADSAGVIEIHGGEQIRNADFQVEQSFVPREIAFRVTWADGRAVDHPLIFAQAVHNPSALASVAQQGSPIGYTVLRIHPNETYTATVRVDCQFGANHTIDSDQIEIAPGDNRTEISLTLPGIRCAEQIAR